MRHPRAAGKQHHLRPQRLRLKSSQQGIALILFVMVVIISATMLYVGSRSPDAINVKRTQSTLATLKTLKEALIAYAVTHDTVPGGLPCPDSDNDGEPNVNATNTGCATPLGWLPFESLEIPEPTDGSGERFWYAVSSNFQELTTGPLNSDTSATISLNGDTDYIAVIIAPQQPVANQTRGLQQNWNVNTSLENYLEDINAETPLERFSTSDQNPTDDNPFNDIVLGIKLSEVLPALEQRVAAHIVEKLGAYRDEILCSTGELPDAVAFDGGIPSPEAGAIPTSPWDSACSIDDWFDDHDWEKLTYYQRCKLGNIECPEYCRNINCPSGTWTQANAIVIVAGRALASQLNRSDTTLPLADYLDEYFENQDFSNRRFIQQNPNKSPTTHNDTVRPLDF